MKRVPSIKGRLPPRLQLCPACGRHAYPDVATCPECGCDFAEARREYEEKLRRVEEARARLEEVILRIQAERGEPQ